LHIEQTFAYNKNKRSEKGDCMKKTKELEMVRVPIYTPEQLVEKIKKGEKIGVKVNGKQTD
jgi:hypothetical protein